MPGFLTISFTGDISPVGNAAQFGMSLWKANYRLRASVTKGILTVNNFRNCKNKRAYIYLPTLKGIDDQAPAPVHPGRN